MSYSVRTFWNGFRTQRGECSLWDLFSCSVWLCPAVFTNGLTSHLFCFIWFCPVRISQEDSFLDFGKKNCAFLKLVLNYFFYSFVRKLTLCVLRNSATICKSCENFPTVSNIFHFGWIRQCCVQKRHYQLCTFSLVCLPVRASLMWCWNVNVWMSYGSLLISFCSLFTQAPTSYLIGRFAMR